MARRHLYLQWDSTDFCNLRCSHCYHNSEGNSSHQQFKNSMGLEDVFYMIDDLKETAERWDMIPRIAISGGEPLMRKDHLEIFDYTQKQEVITNLLTNGTLITPKKAKEIKDRGIDTIQISIDGTKETHNKIRRRNFAYDKAIEGINNASRENISVVTAMTLMKQNMDEFEDVIENSYLAGARKVGFKTYVPDSKLGTKDPKFVNSLEAYKMLRKTNKLVEKYKGKINVLQSDVLWQIFQDEENDLIKKSKKNNTYLCGCSAGFRILSVLSDGTTYPCRRLPLEIGNIKEGIKNIFLNNELMKELRNLNRIRENSLCDKVVHCRGCRAISYATTGDYMAKDPMCFKEYLEDDKCKTE